MALPVSHTWRQKPALHTYFWFVNGLLEIYMNEGFVDRNLLLEMGVPKII